MAQRVIHRHQPIDLTGQLVDGGRGAVPARAELLTHRREHQHSRLCRRSEDQLGEFVAGVQGEQPLIGDGKVIVRMPSVSVYETREVIVS